MRAPAAKSFAPRIGLVEDEDALAELLRYNLEAEGYRVDAYTRGDEAETGLRDTVPDLILLDWMLPDTPGVEFARRLRADQRTRNIPIIMLTARTEERDKVMGLESGADDYITKPFSPRELVL